MGLGVKELYAIRANKNDDTLVISNYIPIKKKTDDGEDAWHTPKYTPLGLDIYGVPNFFPDLKFEDEPIKVKVVKADEDTGMWLIVADEYFGGEEHLFTQIKPSFQDYNCYFSNGNKMYKIDWKKTYDSCWENHLHIVTDMNTKSGDLFPVKLIKCE